MKTTTDTPRTDEEIWTTDFHHELCDVVNKEFAQQLEMELTEKTNEVERLKELVEWYKSGMESCWHVANTYDGNYVKACDNVMRIASERLLVKEELKAEIK
jgi:hypothetical protein